MTFEYGQMYQHRNMIDVAIKVVASRPIDDAITLNVDWFNINYNSFIGQDIITIKNADLPSWNIYTS